MLAHPKGWQQSWLSQGKAKSPEFYQKLPKWILSIQTLGSSAAFRGTLTGSCFGSSAPGKETSMYTWCQHHRLMLNSLCHKASSIFKRQYKRWPGLSWVQLLSMPVLPLECTYTLVQINVVSVLTFYFSSSSYKNPDSGTTQQLWGSCFHPCPCLWSELGHWLLSFHLMPLK